MTLTTVINIKNLDDYRAALASGRYIYGGRGGPLGLGNPFVVGKHGTREEVILLHKTMLEEEATMRAAVIEHCSGKIIGCYCKPKACHCDTYADICNRHWGLI